jgi:uncharacterized protein (DUF433 family)
VQENQQALHRSTFNVSTCTLVVSRLRYYYVRNDLSPICRKARLSKPSSLSEVKVMTTNDRILIDPAICHGKPVVRGTRVPVSIVVGSLAGGMGFEEVQREYDLTQEEIRAALAFASALVNEESFHLLRGAA